MSNGCYNSLNGALDTIIRNFLLNELPPEDGESTNTRHNIAERDIGLAQIAASLQNFQASLLTSDVRGGEANNNETRAAGPAEVPTTVPNPANEGAAFPSTDQEYIKALHHCFEKRGVFKELQTFLRHKLVLILQDEWPNLRHCVGVGVVDEPNTIVFRLVEDFLKSHKLLYTLSVLASESDVKQNSNNAQYGKLPSIEAESLLDEMGIKRNSRLSGQILKCYFDKRNYSMLESMQYLGIWLDSPLDNLGEAYQRERFNAQENVSKLTQQTQTRREEKHEKYIEQRMEDLERKLDREKEAKLKTAIEKFKSEERIRMDGEFEERLRQQTKENEREHLREMHKKIDELKAEMDSERQEWYEVKVRQERELIAYRKQISELRITIASNQSTKIHSGYSFSHHEPNKVSSEHREQMVMDPPKESSEVVPLFVHCSCDCKHKSSCAFPTARESSNAFPSRKSQASIESIQQDKMVFLQYQLEQQEAEIKSLQKKILLSPPQRQTGPKSTELRKSQSDESSMPQTNGMGDLGNFISESKLRIERLDTAASKVDELVQEFFSNKAKTNGPLTDLVARLSSRPVSKRAPLSAMRTEHTSGILPSLGISSMNGFGHHSHLHQQQLPERQTPSISSIINNLPTLNTDMFRRRELQPIAEDHFNGTSKTSENVLERQTEDVRSLATPKRRIFHVAYGEESENVTNSQDKSNAIKTAAEKASKSDQIKVIGNISGKVSAPVDREPEESLFHMAIKSNDKSSSSEKSLKEKALRHGALSRQKVLSPDEGEISGSSRNTSFSESLKVTKSSNNKILRLSNNSNSSGSPISKSKVVDESRHKSANAARRESEFRNQTKSSNHSPDSVSSRKSAEARRKSLSLSTSSPLQKQPERNQESRKMLSNLELSDNEPSSDGLSISAPKSLDDGNNDDFWKL